MSRRIERRIGIAIAAVFVIFGGGLALRSATMETRVDFRLDLIPPGGASDATSVRVDGVPVDVPSEGWILFLDDRPHQKFPVPLTLSSMREIAPLEDGSYVPTPERCERILREDYGFEGELRDRDDPWVNFDGVHLKNRLVWFNRVRWMHPGGIYDSVLLVLVRDPAGQGCRVALVRMARERQVAITGWDGGMVDEQDGFWEGILTGVREYRRQGELTLSSMEFVLSGSGLTPAGREGATGWYLDDPEVRARSAGEEK